MKQWTNRNKKSTEQFAMNRAKLLTTLVATTTILFEVTGNAQAITFSGTSSGSWGLPVVSVGA